MADNLYIVSKRKGLQYGSFDGAKMESSHTVSDVSDYINFICKYANFSSNPEFLKLY